MKYRVWDNVKERFRDDVYLRPDGEVQEWYPQAEIEECRFIVELFTSLKDKNGKGVYEGDIVQYEDNFGTNQYPDMRTFTEEVRLVGGAFDPISEIPTGIITVVGNIHENPELLEEAL